MRAISPFSGDFTWMEDLINRQSGPKANRMLQEVQNVQDNSRSIDEIISAVTKMTAMEVAGLTIQHTDITYVGHATRASIASLLAFESVGCAVTAD